MNYHIGLRPHVIAAVRRTKREITITELAERLTRKLGRTVTKKATWPHLRAMIDAGTLEKTGRGRVQRGANK